ncbi:MAG: YHYH protein [Verrucomicrobia bacterium]|nr:YHYH protein [Verrucomicrobiota bacterium]
MKHLLPSLVFLAASAVTSAHPGHDGSITNSVSTGSTCGYSSLPAPRVSITEEVNYRVIRANGIPNHPVGQFPGPGNPNTISAQNYNFRMPLHPTTNATFTELRHQAIGVALNGIPFDPGTAETWKNDSRSGWHIEAIVGKRKGMGLDQNNAHVQPNGAYHYHAVPTGLVQVLGGDTNRMTLLGYAADGFPIYGPLGYSVAIDPASVLKELKPDDGTYREDYEFVSGSGDLDEANGRVGVTPEYPEGTYYYVATDSFPFYPRELKGTPNKSFQRQGPPPQGQMQGPGGPGKRMEPPPFGGPPPR